MVFNSIVIIVVKVVEGDLVAQFVLVVTFTREVMRQALTDAGDDVTQTVDRTASLQILAQFLGFTVPKALGYRIVDARIAQDGKLASLRS